MREHSFAVPLTNSTLKVHRVLHKVLRLPKLSTLRYVKYCACLEIYASRSTKDCNYQEIRTYFKVHKMLRPPRNPHIKTAHRRKAAQISCTVEKSNLDHQKTCAWYEKSSPRPKMCATPPRERSFEEHPLGPTRFCEPVQSKCTSNISR